MSTTIADMPDQPDPTHLLLGAPSKNGKTRWVADAANDGCTLFYIDADNGLSTLKKHLTAEGKKRVHYVATHVPFDFSVAFFGNSSRYFRWNKTKDQVFSANAADTDEILEIQPKRIPFGVISCLDSWTSTMLHLLQDSARRNGVSFETFNDGGQAAYGDANRRANQLGFYIQHFPSHVIVQAHPEHYERLEKPKGKMVTKAKEMIVKENIQVPQSCSKPHGFGMMKFFNENGWMYVNNTEQFIIDFTQKPDRVGGGSPMKAGDPSKLRWSNLFGAPVVNEVEDITWIRTVPAGEIKAAIEAAKPVAASSTGTKSASPVVPKLGMLKR